MNLEDVKPLRKKPRDSRPGNYYKDHYQKLCLKFIKVNNKCAEFNALIEDQKDEIQNFTNQVKELKKEIKYLKQINALQKKVNKK